jgi:hypothetical protein
VLHAAGIDAAVLHHIGPDELMIHDDTPRLESSSFICAGFSFMYSYTYS